MASDMLLVRKCTGGTLAVTKGLVGQAAGLVGNSPNTLYGKQCPGFEYLQTASRVVVARRFSLSFQLHETFQHQTRIVHQRHRFQPTISHASPPRRLARRVRIHFTAEGTVIARK